MKTVRKAVLAVLCVALVIMASITGTLAYLTDDEAVVNTFTVGNVKIKLDEAPVDSNGKETTGDRVKENTYHLLPGQTYDKDPTVTIIEGSEESYIRMLVEVSDIAKLKDAFPVSKYPDYYNGEVFLLQMLVTGWDSAKWNAHSVDGNTYEFRYHTTVTGPTDDNDKVEEGTALEALFTDIVIPGTVNNDELANLQGVTITVKAHAIQAAGFDDADAAWKAFDAQKTPNS